MQASVTWLHVLAKLNNRAVVSKFWHQGLASWKTILPWTGVGGDSFMMIHVHYIYCALNSYYYYISYISNHQVRMPEVGNPCLVRCLVHKYLFPFYGHLFNAPNSILWSTEVLNLIKSNLSTFLFCCLCF